MTRRSLSKSRGPGRDASRAAVVAGAIAGVVVAAVVLTGCSAASIPPPPPTEAEITDAMVTYVDEQAANRADMHPEIWEQVEFERFISQDDASHVLEACLSGFGVTGVEVDRDGGTIGTETSDGDLQAAAAVDACFLSYPFDDEKSRVRTDAQLEDIYRYETAFLVPCLQSQGMATGEPPTLEEFLDGAHRDLVWWNPYDTLDYRGVMWPNYDIDPTAYDLRANELMVQCPPTSDGP